MRSVQKKAIVLVIILAIYFVGNTIYAGMQDKTTEKRLEMGFDISSAEDRVAALKDVSSDMTDMSAYDKYKQGLYISNDSDTDGDGLTDKDEVEKYHTDPLKASTAEDLYTDGYKVSMGWNPTEAREYEGTPVFSNNACPNVNLTTTVADDLGAVVEDITATYSLENQGIADVYAAYHLYNYGGQVSMDMTQVLAANRITTNDMKFYVYQGQFFRTDLGKIEKCDYKVDGTNVTLDYAFNRGNSYYIFCTSKKTIASSIKGLINRNLKNGGKNATTKDEYVAMIYGSPLLMMITSGKVGMKVMYSGTEDKTKTEENKNQLVRYFIDYNMFTDDMNAKADNVIEKNRAEIQSKYRLLKKYFPIFAFSYEDNNNSLKVTKNNFQCLLFSYTYRTTSELNRIAANGIDGENGDKEQRYNYKQFHTDFDQYEDELSFQNFESDLGPTGNCAGIAHLTSVLYNTGSYAAEGQYNNITWNLATDEDNATLMNPGLFDYKDIHFVDNHSEAGNDYLIGLTDGETEFVKMIGAAFQEANDRVDIDDYTKYNGELYDYSLAEKMMAYLDQGKILDVYLLFNNGSGHAINVYDYYLNTHGEIVFKVYDSNIPQNDRTNFDTNQEGASYLQVRKVLRSDGTEAMDYLYYPTEYNVGYLATSDYNLMQQNAMIVLDENWNIFN